MKGIRSEGLLDRLERFSKKTENGCIEWTGYIEPTGYGTVRHSGKRYKAHRASWIAHYGEIEKGLVICHTCDNRKCINPDHLFIGTQQDNINDMKSKCRDKFVGSQNGRAKLTDSDVIAIRESLSSGVSRAELARQFNVSWSTVDEISSGKKWKHVSSQKVSVVNDYAKKLTKENIEFIRLWHSLSKLKRKDIAEMFGVSISNVDQITSNKIWKDD